MAAAVLATDALPDALRAAGRGKAEGNPFYVEELVKSLEESGALRRVEDAYALTRPLREIAIPDTIQDVIAARIDRLAEAPKRTLQLAAVIGREFTRRLVDRLAEIRERTDGLLRELTALELIHERRLFPSWPTCSSTRSPRTWPTPRCWCSGAASSTGSSASPSRSSTPTGCPSTTRCSPITSRGPRTGSARSTYLLKAAEKATQAFGLRQALELYGEALAASRRLGDRVPATTLDGHPPRARRPRSSASGDFVRSREAAETLVALARRVEDRPAEANALVQLRRPRLQWLEDFPAALRARAGRDRDRGDDGRSGPLGGGLYVRGYVHARQRPARRAEADVTARSQIGRARRRSLGQALALHMLRDPAKLAGTSTGRAWSSAGEGIRLAREHRLVVPLLRCLWNSGAGPDTTRGVRRALAALLGGAGPRREDRRRCLHPALPQHARVAPHRVRRPRPGHRAVRAVVRGDRAVLARRPRHRRRAPRLHPEQRGRRLDGPRRSRRRRRGSGGVAPHRPASAAVPLDDLALHDALLREPGPARARCRATPTRARRLAEQSLETGRADALAQVRGLGVADQGRERDRTTRLGRGGGRAATRARLRGGDRPAAPDLAEPRRARAPRRGAWPSRQRVGALSLRVGHHHGPARAGPGMPTLRAGLESSPLVREVEHLARPE